jgi:hypothetical protein
VAKLSGDFGHELGPEALGKDAAMRSFIASAPYRAWLEAQGSG